MNTLPDLILREIDTQKLPKRATNILDGLDRYIVVMNKKEPKPEVIPLFAHHYKILAEKLKDSGQDIEKLRFRGYRLVRHCE